MGDTHFLQTRYLLLNRNAPNQSSRLTPTRFVYFLYHLACRLDDVHSALKALTSSINLIIAKE